MPRPEKKKLGNNLNKLLVQPNAAAPPIKDSKAAAARQGLLLLSARKSHGLLSSASGNAAASTPLTAPSATTAAAATQKTAVYAESKVTQHEVLLSVVNKGKQTAEKKDAWGTAQTASTVPTTAEERASGTVPSEGTESGTVANPRLWEEDDTHNHQEATMSRLAKERAEKRQSEEHERVQQQQERAAARLKGLEEKQSTSFNSSGRSRSLWEPEETKKAPPEASSEPMDAYNRGPPAPVVHHLSSYEDRDRGERQAGPRMLFDPKSGSMVAVKARDENHGRGNRKERGGGEARGRKNGRTQLLSRENNKSQEAPSMILENRRKKTEPKQPSERKGGAMMNPSRRLPRTRGVLYTRDEKGNLMSADGCEGDLGYGAHSVPGGRMNNPEAYKVFLQEQEKHLENGTEAQVPSYYNATKYQEDGEEPVTLQTGFHPEEEVVLGPLEWIKADDKMELVTGADDSPMLKPTAKEWAPSQAALAAAAAVAKEQQNHPVSAVDDNMEDTEDDEGSGSEFGLGFDPTLDMDGLLSPTTSNSKHSLDGLAGVDLQALTLEPPIFTTAADDKNRPAHTHLFSFGTSGTWGVSSAGNENTSNDWGVLFGADAFRKTSDPTSFLNLPSGNSWGSSSLGGIPLNGGGDTAKTPGD